MPINFACPRCSRRLAIATRKAGAEVSCPACKQRIIVPEPPENKPLPGILIEPGPLESEPNARSRESDAPELVDEPEPDRRDDDEPPPREPVDDYDPLPIRRRRKKSFPWPLLFVGVLAVVALVAVIAAGAKVKRDREMAKAQQVSKQDAKGGGTKQKQSAPAPAAPQYVEDERPRIELPRITEEDERRATYGLKTIGVIVGYFVFGVCSFTWIVKDAMRAKRHHMSVVASSALRGVLSGMVVGCGVGIGLSQYWPVFTSAIPFERIAEPWSPARIDGIPIHLLVFGLVGGGVGGAGLALSEMSHTERKSS